MFRVGQKRYPKLPDHPDRHVMVFGEAGITKWEKREYVHDVLDKDGKILLTYFSHDRATAVVAFLNKMAESSVKELS